MFVFAAIGESTFKVPSRKVPRVLIAVVTNLVFAALEEEFPAAESGTLTVPENVLVPAMDCVVFSIDTNLSVSRMEVNVPPLFW